MFHQTVILSSLTFRRLAFSLRHESECAYSRGPVYENSEGLYNHTQYTVSSKKRKAQDDIGILSFSEYNELDSSARQLWNMKRDAALLQVGQSLSSTAETICRFLTKTKI